LSISRTSNFRASGDELTLSLETEPRHGRILVVTGTGRVSELRTNSSTVWNALRDGDWRLVYRHDGSESTRDGFELTLSDGRRARSARGRVTVISGGPVLATNSLVRVPLGGATIITSDNLRATDDQQVRLMTSYVSK